MKSNETELIVEHALLNESNLTLAAKIGEAYPRLREEVIRRFLTLLQDEMRSTLGTDWIVEIEREEKGSPYLYVKGLAWPEDVHFGISSENGCLSWVYVYVMKCGDTLGNVFLDEELQGSLKELFERWKCGPTTVWHVLDKYCDWGAGDTLVEIYRASEVLEYVKALLLAMHRTVAPIIDANLPPVRH